jgi:hypothetical protein
MQALSSMTPTRTWQQAITDDPSSRWSDMSAAPLPPLAASCCTATCAAYIAMRTTVMTAYRMVQRASRVASMPETAPAGTGDGEAACPLASPGRRERPPAWLPEGRPKVDSARRASSRNGKAGPAM